MRVFGVLIKPAAGAVRRAGAEARREDEGHLKLLREKTSKVVV